ncbi:MAG: hypothetical protein RLZZ227_2264 [Pseudomonadota bacterium]|jgi:hypothetical protein
MVSLLNTTPALSLALKALVFVLVVGLAQDASAANTYRYINDEGHTVLGSTVPPQFVKNGYEIINERGVVIEVVARAKTEAELAAQAAERERQLAEEQLLKKQQEADSLLMRLYRSPDEIARKRDERLLLINGQLTALIASLEKTESELAVSKKLVDDYASQSKEAPAQTVETVRIQQVEVERLAAQRKRLEDDRAAAVADAERDMKRLVELLGLPEDTAAQ